MLLSPERVKSVIPHLTVVVHQSFHSLTAVVNRFMFRKQPFAVVENVIVDVAARGAGCWFGLI
jgi:hypothetical protein